jgi:hypothetical protein
MKTTSSTLSLLFVSLLTLLSAISSGQNVLTRANDIGRTGMQLNESTLTTGNVNSSTFGKVFTYTSITGQIYAQPLAVANLNVTGCHASPHCNVVFVATEDDYLYAFDADGSTSSTSPLWTVNLATNVLSIDTYVTCTQVYSGCNSNSALYPHIGVTGTPVIDTSTNTLYVMSAVNDPGSPDLPAGIFDYLHAINITNGNEKFNGPLRISAQVTGAANPPTRCSTSTQSATVYFSSIKQLQRPGLLLLNGVNGNSNHVVYIGFSMYDGGTPTNGWILGYDAQTLQQVAVFNTTPFGTGGGIWESGAGLAAGVAADGKTYIYAPTGDGTFDANVSGNVDYGNSLLKLTVSSTGALSIASGSAAYFTPSDQSTRCPNDTDFGSGGVMLFPYVSITGHTNLMVNAEKTGYLWVVDRDNLSGFNTTDAMVEKANTQVKIGTNYFGGYWSSPAYFEWSSSTSKAIYYVITLAPNLAPPPLNQYVLNSTQPIPVDAGGHGIATSTTTLFCAPVPTPSVSAKSDQTNGILWAVEDSNTANTGSQPKCNGTPSGAVLHAYDATNVASQLYTSTTSIQANTPTKFLPPTVFNGRVYVGTYQGLTVGGTAGELDVFGLCASGPLGHCI